MNLKKIMITTSLILGATSLSFADTTSTSDNSFYAGIGANATMGGVNSKTGNSGFNGVLGYNLDKYFGVQYTQFVTYNGTFGGLFEGVLNFSNPTIVTPYATGGYGYASLTNDVKPAWDVGGGLKFEVSKSADLFVDYKYIQTIGSTTYIGDLDSNAAGSINTISAGVNFYFG